MRSLGLQLRIDLLWGSSRGSHIRLLPAHHSIHCCSLLYTLTLHVGHLLLLRYSLLHLHLIFALYLSLLRSNIGREIHGCGKAALLTSHIHTLHSSKVWIKTRRHLSTRKASTHLRIQLLTHLSTHLSSHLAGYLSHHLTRHCHSHLGSHLTWNLPTHLVWHLPTHLVAHRELGSLRRHPAICVGRWGHAHRRLLLLCELWVRRHSLHPLRLRRGSKLLILHGRRRRRIARACGVQVLLIGEGTGESANLLRSLRLRHVHTDGRLSW